MSLVDLPSHLIVDILKLLPDTRALAAAKITHSAIHYAFKQHTRTILEAIITNQIPAKMLPFAQAAHSARCKPFGTAHVVETLRELYFGDQDPGYNPLVSNALGPLTLPKAIDMSEMYHVIRYYTRRIENEIASSTNPRFGTPTFAKRQRLTSKERFIIKRALYRFEMYCGLFYGDGGGLDADTKRQNLTRNLARVTFLSYSPPWVNEQLGSIYDFLEQFLSESFDTVAAHDVEWGARKVGWVRCAQDNPWKQGMLSYGLRFLCRLDLTKGYDAQRALLNSKNFPYTSNMLASHLSEVVVIKNDEYMRNATVGHWSRDRYRQRLDDWDDDRHAPVDGVDHFPCWIWTRVTNELYMSEAVFHKDNALLRNAGYVLWDHASDRFGDFYDTINQLNSLRRPKMQLQMQLEMEESRSFEDRKEIFDKGGQGYWSKGNMRRIEWHGIRDKHDLVLPGLAEISLQSD